MLLPTSSCDDPHQPSTSTAPQRRKEENLKKFERLFPTETPKTLLYVCTAKHRGKLQSAYTMEFRKLQGLNFETLLRPHQAYLNNLAKMSGSTFQILCKDLRFLATSKMLPPSLSNNEHSNPLFKLVANCVVYKNNAWDANIDRLTLYDAVTADALNKISHDIGKLKYKEEKDVKPKEPEPEPEPPRRTNPKRGAVESPVLRLSDIKRKPPPIPEPYQPQRHSNFSPMLDEHLRAKHSQNSINEVDSTFCARRKTLKNQLSNTSQQVRKGDRELSDEEYYCDDIVLLPQHISFRVEHVAQITDFPLPHVKSDGYFPPERNDREWYLYEKYNQCNQECRDRFNQLRPPNGLPVKEGFIRLYPYAHELLMFHNANYHIHGFFDVWQETEKGWLGKDGKWFPRRYLVDIYNHFMFPLYIDVNDWSENLKKTFDKISFYNLKLMTVIRRHLESLKTIGDMLFVPYPARLEKNLKNIQSAKVRNAYSSQIQVENTRVVDLKCFIDPKYLGTIEEEGKKKPRRARKSDPQSDATPKTSRVRGKNALSRAILQKENMDKMILLSPPSVAGLMTPGKRRSLENPSPRRNAPTATKRRNDDTASLQPPPVKKTMPDSWDEHRHRALVEEHVDDEPELMAAQLLLQQAADGKVWKPQDKGLSPEEYATQILVHYGVKKGEDNESGSNNSSAATSTERVSGAISANTSASSTLPQGPLADLVADIPNEGSRGPPSLAPPMPVVKQRRSRKSNPKPPPPTPSNATAPVLQERDDSQIPTSSSVLSHEEPLLSNVLTTPKSVLNGSNVQSAVKPNRTYSMKITPNSNKAVFPVKKLAPSLHVPSAATNGNSSYYSPFAQNSPAFLALRNAIIEKAQLPIIATPSSEPIAMHPHQPGTIGFSKEVLAAVEQNRVPYYHTGIYSKTDFMSPSSRFDATLLQPSTSSASSSTSSSASVKTIGPLTTPRLPSQQPRIIQPPPPHRLPFDVATPASRAINHHQQRQFDGIADSGKCRRAMSYNDQMAYKNQRWESKKKAASVPPNAHQTLPAIQRSMSNTPGTAEPVLTHRPRSQSNNGVLTMARPRQMLAIPPAPTSPERSVGVPNSRQSVPWVANSNRARSTSSTRTAPAATTQQQESPGPLLPSSTNLPWTTTTAYTVMDSSRSLPSTLPRAYTSYSRKTHSMTPEELGSAVRRGSQRFQDERNGGGPSVKSYLRDLNTNTNT